jgi:hypothetical protein
MLGILLAHKDQLAQQAKLGLKGSKAYKEFKALKVKLDLKVQKEIREILV